MMYELLVIGAGPGGIALAAEGTARGIDASQILILDFRVRTSIGGDVMKPAPPAVR